MMRGRLAKGLALVAMGALLAAGSCLDSSIFRLTGNGVALGSGWEVGRDLTQTFVLGPVTMQQDAVNTINAEEAVAAELASRGESGN